MKKVIEKKRQEENFIKEMEIFPFLMGERMIRSVYQNNSNKNQKKEKKLVIEWRTRLEFA